MKEEWEPIRVELKKDGKSGGYKEINSVLTFKMSPETCGLINWDYNATKNMQEIVRNLLETGKKPKEFERTKKPVPEKGIKLGKAKACTWGKV